MRRVSLMAEASRGRNKERIESSDRQSWGTGKGKKKLVEGEGECRSKSAGNGDGDGNLVEALGLERQRVGCL